MGGYKITKNVVLDIIRTMWERSEKESSDERGQIERRRIVDRYIGK